MFPSGATCLLTDSSGKEKEQRLVGLIWNQDNVS